MIVFKVNSHGWFFYHKVDQMVLKMKFFIYFWKQKDHRDDDGGLQGQLSRMFSDHKFDQLFLKMKIFIYFLKWKDHRDDDGDLQGQFSWMFFLPQIWPIGLENEIHPWKQKDHQDYDGGHKGQFSWMFFDN